MSQRHVLVIGAGAAGLTAAIRAAEAGARVTLLNAHPKPGLKILMSGGTRCNVTHEKVTERDFFGGSRNVVARILRAFNVQETLNWFEDHLGVALKLEDTGKYFPLTDDANTVLDALLREAERAGVVLRMGARVVRLTRVANGWRAGIQRVRNASSLGEGVVASGQEDWPLPAVHPDEWEEADAVVFATGGLSFPRSGTDGTGYALLASIGHTMTPPFPALVPLTSNDTLCAAAQGVTTDVALTLHAAGAKPAKFEGSLLVAHFGYSGPVALDLSRHFAAADPASRRVTCNFVPHADREWLLSDWLARAERESARTVRRHLGGWLPDRLACELAWDAEVDPARELPQVSRERREALFRQLLERDLRVTGTLGYEKAEVTAGGVPLSEVDASTLESRVAPGVFLCGEVLDVEGRLGGFNFQWAWSSGTVAGRAAGASG